MYVNLGGGIGMAFHCGFNNCDKLIRCISLRKVAVLANFVDDATFARFANPDVNSVRFSY